MRIKKLSVVLISLLFLIYTPLKAYSSNPKDFINELVNDAISKLSDKTIQVDEKVGFIENIAIKNVDIKALGLYTLGELRKSTEKKTILKYEEINSLNDFSSFRQKLLNGIKSLLLGVKKTLFSIIS